MTEKKDIHRLTYREGFLLADLVKGTRGEEKNCTSRESYCTQFCRLFFKYKMVKYPQFIMKNPQKSLGVAIKHKFHMGQKIKLPSDSI